MVRRRTGGRLTDCFPCAVFFHFVRKQDTLFFLSLFFFLCSSLVKQQNSTHIHTVSSGAGIEDGIAVQAPLVLPISRLFCNHASRPSFVHVTKESLSSESQVFLLAERGLWVRVGAALTVSSAARCRGCSRAEWSSSLSPRHSPSRLSLVFTQ